MVCGCVCVVVCVSVSVCVCVCERECVRDREGEGGRASERGRERRRVSPRNTSSLHRRFQCASPGGRGKAKLCPDCVHVQPCCKSVCRLVACRWAVGEGQAAVHMCAMCVDVCHMCHMCRVMHVNVTPLRCARVPTCAFVVDDRQFNRRMLSQGNSGHLFNWHLTCLGGKVLVAGAGLPTC